MLLPLWSAFKKKEGVTVRKKGGNNEQDFSKTLVLQGFADTEKP